MKAERSRTLLLPCAPCSSLTASRHQTPLPLNENDDRVVIVAAQPCLPNDEDRDFA